VPVVLLEPKLTIISFVSTKPPAHPEYWQLVPHTSDNLHILMWQSALQNCVGFGHHKSFKA
jgi:hypothetical protein